MTTLGEWYGVNIVSGLAGCVNEALVPMAVSIPSEIHKALFMSTANAFSRFQSCSLSTSAVL